jgi:hypothetical protein
VLAEVEGWAAEFERLMERIGPRFARPEVRRAGEVCGGDARLRAFLEERHLSYVLAVNATQPLWAHGEQGPAELPARELVANLPARAWRRLSAGDGAKGPRVYDWARVALNRPGWPGRGFWLLARRRPSGGELAFFACSARRAPNWWESPDSLCGGGMLPSQQGPGRLGPLPGPPLRRLVPARQLGDGRPGQRRVGSGVAALWPARIRARTAAAAASTVLRDLARRGRPRPRRPTDLSAPPLMR